MDKIHGLVTMSLTRYNWLVDGQPTQNRYTVLGDVTGSIEVSMEFKTTVPTEILRTIPTVYYQQCIKENCQIWDTQKITCGLKRSD